MPDDRLFHKCLGRSEKVNKLTDFERGVWWGYVLCADDFGVMRFSAVTLQDGVEWLERKPSRTVQRGLESVRDVGLIRTFEHQGRAYCYQHDWQDWQKIEYPRTTIQPRPKGDDCSEKTRQLFAKHPGGWGRRSNQTSAERSPNVPQGFPKDSPTPSGEIAREPLAVSRQPVAVREEALAREVASPLGTSKEHSERAGRFLERYDELHRKYLRGAPYLGKMHLDYQEALSLVRVYEDERLDKLAIVWLNQQDEFATNGTRTIAKFRSRASACDEFLRERGK